MEIIYLDRRRFMAGLSVVLASMLSRWKTTTAIAEPTTGEPFDRDKVRAMARQLALQPYQEPERSLSKEFGNLNYDAHRQIRFRPERAVWKADDLPFQLQFFHRGWLFLDRVEIFEVNAGRARPLNYAAELFNYGELRQRPETADMGFAGFRIHGPILRPDYYDEIGVFLGASYYRAVARDQLYGLSARALSISTGDPKGEEFPAFRAFWVERPTSQAKTLVVHALVDSKSAAAALRFEIRPGQTTIYDVELTVCPRNDISQIGIGSLTSMFLFAPNDRIAVDDYRPAVHDSDGLMIQNGRGEEIWRPLSNPRDLQISVFSDKNPRSFGLCQRERDFHWYEDIESRFEKRPSAWVEPKGEWGEGAIHLLEIPSKEEIHDNIVAFWRPKDPLRAKGEYEYSYRLNWGSKPATDDRKAQFVKTRCGAGPDHSRRFVLDLQGPILRRFSAESFRGVVTADKGEVRNVVTYPNPVTGGIRISFELLPKKERVVELRGQIMRNEDLASEIWLYRWTP